MQAKKMKDPVVKYLELGEVYQKFDLNGDKLSHMIEARADFYIGCKCYVELGNTKTIVFDLNPDLLYPVLEEALDCIGENTFKGITLYEYNQ